VLLLSQISGQDEVPLAGFADSADARVLHYLPVGLGLARDAQGEEDFMLLRYRSLSTAATPEGAAGGLLRGRWQLQAPPSSTLAAAQAAGWMPKAVGFVRGFSRLLLRSQVGGESMQTGAWRSLTLSGSEVVSYSVGLSPDEVQLLHALVEGGGSIIEVEAELVYQGLRGGLPYLASADRDALRAALATALGSDAVREDQIVAAFLSLPSGAPNLLRWQPLCADAQADEVTLRTELAHRAAARFFVMEPAGAEREPARYRLRVAADEPERVSIDLSGYRIEARSLQLSWSMSELYAALPPGPARERCFPEVALARPFAATTIHVICDLSFESRGLLRVHVDLKFPGAGGVPEHRGLDFDGSRRVVRVPAIYPALTTSFAVEYRITATLAPPGGSGWPITWRRDYRRAQGTVVEISGQTAELDFLYLEAEVGCFVKARSFEITVADSVPPRALSLTQEQPRACIPLPGHLPSAALMLRCVALPRADAPAEPQVLWDAALAGRTLRIMAAQLELWEPDLITLQLDAESARRCAYISVNIASAERPPSEREESTVYWLTPGEPRVVPLLRSSVFEPLAFRYRLHYVPRDADGATRSMVSTDWLSARGAALTVKLPASP